MSSDNVTGATALPVIDMKEVKVDRKAAAKKIVDILENVGFAYVDNVDGIDYKGLWDCCQWFFNKPMDFKKKIMRKQWNPENTNLYRGYFPVVEGEPSRKEGFEFARDVPPDDSSVSPTNWFYEKSTWPEEDGSFPFKTFLQQQYEVMHDTCMKILRLLAIGLGIPENSFVNMFEDKPCSTFRMLHYPPWKGEPPKNALIEDGKVLTTPEHMDSVFMTLLTPFQFGGLEILQADGKWAEVINRRGSLVMNIGVTFSRMLGGRFKATRHRVLDVGTDRYSVPFFLEPKYDADIGINYLSKVTGNGPAHVTEKYGPWVLHRMKYEEKFYEFKDVPDIDE
ncbi:1-aminocyclopropane-1-carboxylate oxidase-like [Mercenaria mercenaria]|uniref:1-aminocyclopropane-1-carboxylate oxidase-like n=1 Tax=Mercenaria mercenaria TaxID=6596 RepID=UPI00234E41BA|nr:1-aminocyclopropane-1-carboxylate oxidase-like [Mercenaria mercenaria]